ncbi:hypothetical protein SteCoe_31941 [Stentor coeruleus]|uniref:t-SNARE coiled-coil homology domain-containing protein n=1 Tax=Stentor coeruleus TaxID=5963 RepID=A0A1R2B025_9CILI|nr:hypothetical protein SteCoe_31941 [Stentor coeruleus]
MSQYSKLPGDSSKGQSKAIKDLSDALKEFEQKLKELKRLQADATSKSTKEAKKIIMEKQDDLINLGNRIRAFLKLQVSTNEKQIFNSLKKTAENLLNQYKELEKSFDSYNPYEKPKTDEEDDDIGPGFVEHEGISFKDANEISGDLLQERQENIQNLHKDFVEVNHLFKEVATLVEQQGEMLDESDKNVDTAVKETARANVELETANTYQRSAKKKALCIFIIVLCVVGALIGIVVASTA